VPMGTSIAMWLSNLNQAIDRMRDKFAHYATFFAVRGRTAL
jgi:hypothetical protein